MEVQEVRYSGLLVLYNNMLQSLYSSQIATLGWSFVVIFIMFLVLLRSFCSPVVATVPTAISAAVMLGGMGFAGIPLDMMTITIASITVGIGWITLFIIYIALRRSCSLMVTMWQPCTAATPP